MRCSRRSVLCFHPYASTTNTTDIAQNLQQSRGFGNNFKFPEGSAPAAGADRKLTDEEEAGDPRESCKKFVAEIGLPNCPLTCLLARCSIC